MNSRRDFTVVFIRKDSEILLGFKKRGFGMSKWNGFGGKVEPGESILEAAIRETKEECGLSVEDLTKIAVLEVEFEGNNELYVVHFFETYEYHGELIESEEMKPKWFAVENLPYAEMWPDNEKWYPGVLKDKLYRVHASYTRDQALIKCDVEELKELSIEEAWR